MDFIKTHEAQTLETFELFAQLPVELRFRIWEIARAALLPRVVPLTYDLLSDKYCSNASTPAILHANRESRGVGHKALRLACGTNTHAPHIHFDSIKDTLFLDDWLASGLVQADYNLGRGHVWVGPMDTTEKQMFQRFAFDSDHFHFRSGTRKSKTCLRACVLHSLRQFPNFEELRVVLGSGQARDPYASCKGLVNFVDLAESKECEPGDRCPTCHMRELDDVSSLNEYKRGFERPKDNARAIHFKLLPVALVGGFRGNDQSELTSRYLATLSTDHEIRSENLDVLEPEVEEEDKEEVTDCEEIGDEENLWKEVKDELHDLMADEEEYKALVGEGEYRNFQHLCVDTDYFERRLEL